MCFILILNILLLQIQSKGDNRDFQMKSARHLLYISSAKLARKRFTTVDKWTKSFWPSNIRNVTPQNQERENNTALNIAVVAHSSCISMFRKIKRKKLVYVFVMKNFKFLVYHIPGSRTIRSSKKRGLLMDLFCQKVSDWLRN